MKFTMYLLKSDITTHEEALTVPANHGEKYVKYERECEGHSLTLIITYKTPQIPSWWEFIQHHFALPSIETGDNCYQPGALLFLNISTGNGTSRFCAFTFGYGRFLLRQDSYEKDFGLRVVLNLVNPNQIRSLTAKTYDDLVIAKKIQTSQDTGLAIFGLDVTRDLLRTVTGTPRDRTIAKRVTGKDSLTFSAEINSLEELVERCKTFWEAYHRPLPEEFSWVDNIREVRDPQLIEELDRLLITSLNQKETERMFLAPPEILDWYDIEYFSIQGTRTIRYEDLDIEQYLNNLPSSNKSFTIEQVKKRKVKAYTSDGHEKQWSLYKSLIFETERQGTLYVLLEGKWFAIEQHFAQQIHQALQSIPHSSVPLPSLRPGQKEEDYNRSAADPSVGLYNFDLPSLRIRPSGARDSIEFCDLLWVPQGQNQLTEIIHVKKRYRSSILSHLFSQGLISAQVFLQDREYRNALRHRVSSQYPSLNIAIIPLTRPNAARYRVVYAVVGVKNANSLQDALPFFSQVNLSNHAAQLRLLGFEVAYKLIP